MDPANTTVLSWPIKAPEGAKTQDDDTALAAFYRWLHISEHFCEHKASVTLEVRDNEWPGVMGAVYDHWDKISGVAFLPHLDSVYEQLPFEPITEEKYDELNATMPDVIDWKPMNDAETEDRTTATHVSACEGLICELPEVRLPQSLLAQD